MGPSDDVRVGVPHPSLAVAVPSAALIFEATGLHPSVVAVPVAVITGGVTSTVQVTVLDAVALLPQASVAVHVLVCDAAQLDVVMGPSDDVKVGVPSAALISDAGGLHVRASVVPVAVMVGGVTSTVQVTVLDAVALLPQASVAVHVLVCDAAQLDVVMGPSLDVKVGVPHPSLTVAVPSAAFISDATGLHPSVVAVPVAVITGGVTSTVQVTVLDAVALLPQASVAVHVLVCDAAQLDVVMGPSDDVRVGVPHPSLAVAVPSAAFISEATGLHPSVVAVPVAVITGGVTSTVQVTVRDAVALLPQASVAVHVLVCDAAQLDVVMGPSDDVRVGVPQPSL